MFVMQNKTKTMIFKTHFTNNKAYEKGGVSPLTFNFRCCSAVLVGVFKLNSYAEQQREHSLPRGTIAIA